ncbi:transporter [Methyloceanibacter sp. wino2]|uniref:transporter n=1 Tax=Methyloceanibacter sp. wino2 TaxID=2170729 RepID=UPI001FE0743B|nr:transporter [Methyloceanibacter sp. wino2]
MPLPQGVYFINEAYYMERSGDMIPGVDEVDAVVNIPVLAWSTPYEVLGGRFEAIVFTPQLGVGVNPGATNGSSLWARDFYNPAGLFGVAWDLGGGWSVSNFVGGFTPVDTFIGNYLGGNFWTFADLLGVAYATNGWVFSANFIYLYSGEDLDTGIRTQPSTLDVDFAAVKHVNNWQFGLIGSASTDISEAARNNWGDDEYSQFSLGGLVGYTFGSVTTEVFATRSLAANNQTFGGKDTRISARVTVPLFNPPAPAAAGMK